MASKLLEIPKVEQPATIEAKAVIDMLLLCGELGGKKKGEPASQYLRRLIDVAATAPAVVTEER